ADVDRRHTFHVLRLVDDRLRPRLLVRLRDAERRLRHRGDVVLDVRRNGSKTEINLLGDRAGLGDFRRDTRDALDLVLGDDRARREAPNAAVHNADAEARRLPVGVGRNATECTATAASATPAATAAT